MIASVDALQKTPGVMGGEACIRESRITVWILVGYRELGMSNARLLEAYPSLSLQDAWEYYRQHTSEIDKAIRRNEAD